MHRSQLGTETSRIWARLGTIHSMWYLSTSHFFISFANHPRAKKGYSHGLCALVLSQQRHSTSMCLAHLSPCYKAAKASEKMPPKLPYVGRSSEDQVGRSSWALISKSALSCRQHPCREREDRTAVCPLYSPGGYRKGCAGRLERGHGSLLSQALHYFLQ